MKAFVFARGIEPITEVAAACDACFRHHGCRALRTQLGSGAASEDKDSQAGSLRPPVRVRRSACRLSNRATVASSHATIFQRWRSGLERQANIAAFFRRATAQELADES